MTGLHIGRSWTGHEIEDGCMCHQAACGLVDAFEPGCDQHDPAAARTLRQGHPADACPAAVEAQS